jgi:hypothetical protein
MIGHKGGAAPGRILVILLLGLAAAYQVHSTMTVQGSDLLSAVTYRGFGDPESGFRWSGAHGAIVFPDPGPAWPVRVEVVLSGWRPRGQAAPLVTVSASGHSATVRPSPGTETVSLDTVTSGAWRSDLVVTIDSETFRPGGGDPRTLGVRVIEARLRPLSYGIRAAPLGALVTAAATVLLLFVVLLGSGVAPRAAERAGIAAALALAGGYAFARPWTATISQPLLFAVAAAAVALRVVPRPVRILARVAGEVMVALRAGVLRILDPRVAILCAGGAIAMVAAYRAQPRIEILLGSGGEAAVARGFGAFDAAPGVRYRRAPRGAELDLGDLGGGTPWTIAVTASHEGRPRRVELLRAGTQGLTADLPAEAWTRHALAAPAPFGWRSGLVLEVPGGSEALRISRVDIDRGRAWPSLRIVVAVLAGGLLALVGLGAAGGSATVGLAGAGVVMAGCAIAVAWAPLTAIPFALPFLAIVALGAVLAAAQTASTSLLAERGHSVLPSAAARAAAAAGFVAWLSATAYPLYRGGHFVFHSSIAEEIWKGRFLIYYLPYPGSMLSEQAQWGNVVVPHPALYQTLVAPLASLPRPWFFLAEKALLALLFASLVVLGSILAERVAGRRAGVYTAVVAASLVPSFQLLGLGHLMTILGVWASSVALAWLCFRADRLGQRSIWWVTVALLTFCFLSYTAALLFTAMVLAVLIVGAARGDPALARSLATATAAACLCAFLLYYVHWTWPFLSRSVPTLLGGSAREATPVLKRLALQPGKLAYSYGSLLVPLAGVAGLSLLRPSWSRRVLLAWAGILVVVSAADVFFNFLLKHHYFTMVPVAVGGGVLLAGVAQRGRGGRALAVAALVIMAVLAARVGLDAATGRIP